MIDSCVHHARSSGRTQAQASQFGKLGPKWKGSPKLVPRRQDGQNLLQALADLAHVGVGSGHEWQRDLFLVAFAFIAQMLASSRDGVTLFIQQLLDADNALHVAAPVHALSRAALDGPELWKLGLPE